MRALLDARLRDAGVGGGHTVPTSINADHMHFAKLRLDYALAGPGFADDLADGCAKGPRATVLRDDVTTRLSDHFPLHVSFGAPSDSPGASMSASRTDGPGSRLGSLSPAIRRAARKQRAEPGRAARKQRADPGHREADRVRRSKRAARTHFEGTSQTRDARAMRLGASRRAP